VHQGVGIRIVGGEDAYQGVGGYDGGRVAGARSDGEAIGRRIGEGYGVIVEG